MSSCAFTRRHTPLRISTRHHELICVVMGFQLSPSAVACQHAQICATDFCHMSLLAITHYHFLPRPSNFLSALSRALTCFSEVQAACSSGFVRSNVAAHHCTSFNIYLHQVLPLHDPAYRNAILCPSVYLKFFLCNLLCVCASSITAECHHAYLRSAVRLCALLRVTKRFYSPSCTTEPFFVTFCFLERLYSLQYDVVHHCVP